MKIKPFIHQEQIVSAVKAFPEVSYFALAGGYGCGKSFSIVLEILEIVRAYNGTDISVGICSTTITLLRKTVILDLERILSKTASKYKYNKQDSVFAIGTVKFLLIATDQPNDIYGPNLNICLCDEIDELPESKAIEAHKALSERTRLTLPDGRKPYLMYFSTVHGYRGLYKILKNLDENKVPYILVRGLTKNNTSLDEQYVKNLYALYDEMEQQAYLEGKFVNLQAGRVYSDFDEEKVTIEPFEVLDSDTIMIGQDLNSGFSKAVAVVQREKTLYIVNTWSFKEIGSAPAIMRAAYPRNEILWYPDCSAKEVLKGYKDEIRSSGINCRLGSTNPPILDRVFYVNKLFRLGFLKVFGSKNCNPLVEALKTRAYDDNGKPEKGKGEHAPDHICDALEYVLWRAAMTYGYFKVFDTIRNTGTFEIETKRR